MRHSATPFRLLCVSHYFESHSGGIEAVAGQMARALAFTGLQVTWAASNSSPPPADVTALALPSSNVIERASGLPFPLPGPRALARLIVAVRNADAVIVHDGMYLSSVAAIVAARLLRRPALLVQHIGRVPAPSMHLRLLFGVADRCLTKPMLRLASQVVFISNSSARHFANVRLRREPLLIFNGVDTDIFEPGASANDRRSVREQLGWPNERPTMLFVGRFLEKKGLLRLREMSRRRPDLHWAYAGWGPIDPASWHLPNVSVHRGLSGRGIAALYCAADLLILPSKSEGFPLVVQEALACGLHAVCCDDAAEADPAAASFLSSMSNEGSEEQIVERYLAAITHLISNPARRAERLKRAAFVRERYSWRAAARVYAAKLSELCSNTVVRKRQQEVAA